MQIFSCTVRSKNTFYNFLQYSRLPVENKLFPWFPLTLLENGSKWEAISRQSLAMLPHFESEGFVESFNKISILR